MSPSAPMDTEKRKRFGLLGGTFNPPHMGHFILAQDALEAFALDEVWFLPCAQPAHKPERMVVAAEHRVRMLEEGLGNDPRMRISMIEIERSGVSYTVDTMRQLTKEHPAVDWHFLIGADTLVELPSWRQIDDVLRMCRILSMRRPGMPSAQEIRDHIQLPSPWPDRLTADMFDGHLIDISSTEIRKRVALRQSIRYLVPVGVEHYIAAQGLYQGLNRGEESSNPSS